MKKFVFLLSALLVFMTFHVYYQTLDYGFSGFDDDRVLVNNRNIRDGLTWDSTGWAFKTTYASNWIPLTWLSHALDVEMFGMNPRGHHLMNVLLHFTAAIVLFMAFTSLTGHLWRSFFVAALFAVHPLHVESVAWLTERRDVLCALFYFLTLWSYAWYVRGASWRRYAAVLLLCGAALLSKPMAVTLPLVLLLLDYWPLQRFKRTTPSGSPPEGAYRLPAAGRLLLEKIPLLVMALAVSAATYAAQSQSGAVRSHATYPLTVRIGNAFLSYVRYLGKTAWPEGLAAFYPHPGMDFPWLASALSLLLLLLVTVGVLYGRKRGYFPVGWLWYLMTMAPVIGIIQAGDQAMADRFTYIPSVGLFILLAWGLADLARSTRVGRATATAFSALVLGGLMLGAKVQAGYWRDTYTLFSHALEVTSNNHIAHNAVGLSLYQSGRREEARGHYLSAVSIKSDYEEAHNNLGIYYLQKGNFGKAVKSFGDAIGANPEYGDAYFNLAIAHIEMGDANMALAQYDKIKSFDAAKAERLLRFISYAKGSRPQ